MMSALGSDHHDDSVPPGDLTPQETEGVGSARACLGMHPCVWKGEIICPLWKGLIYSISLCETFC